MKKPNWTKEELLLILHLYMEHDLDWLNRISCDTYEVIQASNLLRSLSIHSKEDRTDSSFRSPSSIHMKLMNFMGLDERYNKGGLSNGSQLDRDVWKEYAKDSERLYIKTQEILFEYAPTTLLVQSIDLEDQKNGIVKFLESALLDMKKFQDVCNGIRKHAVRLESIEDSQKIVTQMYDNISRSNSWETSVSNVIKDIQNTFILENELKEKTITSNNDIQAEIKIGKLVQSTFHKLFNEGKLSNEDINNFANAEWTRNNFRLTHPFLKDYDSTKPLKEQVKVNGYQRYWQEIYSYNGKEYILCKEWFEYNRKFFDAWLNRFFKYEVKIFSENNKSATLNKVYTFSMPTAVRVMDTKYFVKNWTNLLIQVCEAMVFNRPNIIKEFDKSQRFRGKSRKYFSYNKKELTKTAKKLSNGLWVETNFSAQAISELSKLIVSECGYSEQDIEFFIIEKQTNEKITHQEPNRKQVKFSSKYSSIALDENLLRFILQTIKDIDEQDICIETHKLLAKVAPRLVKESTYKYPQHPLNNIFKFLLDVDAIMLYQDAKRGKFIIEDYEMMQKLINNPSIIQDIL